MIYLAKKLYYNSLQDRTTHTRTELTDEQMKRNKNKSSRPKRILSFISASEAGDQKRSQPSDEITNILDDEEFDNDSNVF